MKLRLVLLAVAVLARSVALFLGGGLRLHGDEITYMAMAKAFIGKGSLAFPVTGYPNGLMDLLLWWAPLQGVILMPAAWLGENVLMGRIIGVFVSSLTVLPLHEVTRLRFGARAAFWGALLFGVAPDYVFFGPYLWAENAACLLALTAIVLTYRRRAWAAGVLWGLCALARVSVLTWLPVAAVWSYWAFGRSLRRLLIWALACLALIGLYSLWNSARVGYPVIVADTLGYSIYYGNNLWLEPSSPIAMSAERLLAQETLATADSHKEYVARARALGLRFIRRYPGRFLARGVRKLGWMWGPYTFPVMRIDLGEYGWLRGEFTKSAAVLALQLGHVLTVLLILAGIVLTWREDYTMLIAALMLVTSAGCFATVGLSRYAYPLLVLGTPVAGYAAAAAARGMLKSD